MDTLILKYKNQAATLCKKRNPVRSGLLLMVRSVRDYAVFSAFQNSCRLKTNLGIK